MLKQPFVFKMFKFDFKVPTITINRLSFYSVLTRHKTVM